MTGFRSADAAGVTRCTDLNMLRLGLARMAWIKKALPAPTRRRTIDALAEALLPSIAFARLGVPPMAPATRKAVGRRRGPGGGRPPNVTAHVLASDVARELQVAGLGAGCWRVEGRSSPFIQVLALCRQIVTGVVSSDMRRMAVKRNRWLSSK